MTRPAARHASPLPPVQPVLLTLIAAAAAHRLQWPRRGRLRRARRLLGMPWRQVRWRVQRARRGWSGRDVWGLDTYLAGVISGTVTRLQETTHSHPLGMTHDEWLTILGRIAAPLAAYKTWEDDEIPGEDHEGRLERLTIEYGAVQDAIRLLAEHFTDLWD